jgi:four helix bundle protein
VVQDLCERTFEFSVRIVRLCQTLDEASGVGRTLGRQLLRSGTSIGANVEEGQGGQSKADFVSKYSIARKEARETLYWLRLLVASEVVAEEKLGPLIQECDELIAILTAIIKKTKGVTAAKVGRRRKDEKEPKTPET